MKMKFKGETSVSLTNNKEYEVISIENGWIRLIDDTGEDYLFSPDQFEIIEK